MIEKNEKECLEEWFEKISFAEKYYQQSPENHRSGNTYYPRPAAVVEIAALLITRRRSASGILLFFTHKLKYSPVYIAVKLKRHRQKSISKCIPDKPTGLLSVSLHIPLSGCGGNRKTVNLKQLFDYLDNDPHQQCADHRSR